MLVDTSASPATADDESVVVILCCPATNGVSTLAAKFTNESFELLPPLPFEVSKALLLLLLSKVGNIAKLINESSRLNIPPRYVVDVTRRVKPDDPNDVDDCSLVGSRLLNLEVEEVVAALLDDVDDDTAVDASVVILAAAAEPAVVDTAAPPFPTPLDKAEAEAEAAAKLSFN